jgi:hypothetical protein
MSQSKKKKMAGSAIKTSSSEKKDKQFWHRSFRRKIKIALNIQIKKDDEIIFPKIKEVSNPWLMTKDGKYLYYTEIEIRKNIDSVLNQIQNVNIKYSWKNYSFIIKNMCEYFKTEEPIALLTISSEKINQFIEYFINKEKRK